MNFDTATAIQFWEHELTDVKPYLFNLAWQLVDAYPDYQWNVLICDDNSARLPSQFIQSVLRKAGYELPLRYISAGRKARAVTSPERYTEYVQQILDGVEQPKPLLISEAAGTFKTLRYLTQLFSVNGGIDTGLIASHIIPPKELGKVFVGGYGRGLAATHVYQTFEAPKLTADYQLVDNEPFQGHVLTNLQDSPVAGEPWGHESNDPAYSELAQHCAQRMDELADEYWRLAGKWHKARE